MSIGMSAMRRQDPAEQLIEHAVSVQPVRPALHVRAVFPEQVFSLTPHAGVAHVAPVLAAHNSAVAQVADFTFTPNEEHSYRSAPVHEYVPGTHAEHRFAVASHAPAGQATTLVHELRSVAHCSRVSPVQR
jgi:hypothetical protein